MPPTRPRSLASIHRAAHPPKSPNPKRHPHPARRHERERRGAHEGGAGGGREGGEGGWFGFIVGRDGGAARFIRARLAGGKGRMGRGRWRGREGIGDGRGRRGSKVTNGLLLRSFPLPLLWRFSALVGETSTDSGDRGGTSGLVPSVSPDALEGARGRGGHLHPPPSPPSQSSGSRSFIARGGSESAASAGGKSSGGNAACAGGDGVFALIVCVRVGMGMRWRSWKQARARRAPSSFSRTAVAARRTACSSSGLSLDTRSWRTHVVATVVGRHEETSKVTSDLEIFGDCRSPLAAGGRQIPNIQDYQALKVIIFIIHFRCHQTAVPRSSIYLNIVGFIGSPPAQQREVDLCFT
ncbi:hypothetical protein B0H13DRAFT_2269331 [Mycena leptocephala]|nr:hypothetical protein B0H13DRAFT_2269331 [Mycena leptocephala]